MDTVVGKALDRDLAPGEAVETALDYFIETRDKQRRKEEGDRALEEAWKESERRHTQQRRAEIREAWCTHHSEQASRLRATLEDLIAHHEQRAEELGGDAA